MEEQELALHNLCSDIATYREFEPILLNLFKREAATWHRLVTLAAETSINLVRYEQTIAGSELRLIWLPDPEDSPSYGMIFFFDLNSLWSMGARYNIGRLNI